MRQMSNKKRKFNTQWESLPKCKPPRRLHCNGSLLVFTTCGSKAEVQYMDT